MIFKNQVFILATMAMLMASPAIGFTPAYKPSPMPVPAGTSSHFRDLRGTKLFSSTLPKQGEQKKFNGAQDKSKEAGVEALQRLLKRQQSELEETIRLLETYSPKGGNSTTESSQGADGEPELSSVATSLLKAFDYGFQSRSEGPSFANLKGGNEAFVDYGPPANVWALGTQQFMRNLNAMRNEYEDEDDVGKSMRAIFYRLVCDVKSIHDMLTPLFQIRPNKTELSPEQTELQTKLEQLTLNSTAIWERELKDGPIQAPLVIKIPYLVLCWFLDTVFEGKYVPSRFFLLETVARMPYFSYIAMLHLYETLGFWRRSADMKRIHFAEEMNEFRHLMIMESLGGDQRWWVRFMAQHSALAYYVGLCFLWMMSPSLSYKFSELLETHAVNTYSQFLDENEEKLKDLPPSLAAVDYYVLGASDPYYAEFQTTSVSTNTDVSNTGYSS